MTHPPSVSEQINSLVSDLNHQVTGSLARLEGLYRLYQQEGKFREDLWEQAFGEAKAQLHDSLGQGFILCAQQRSVPNRHSSVGETNIGGPAIILG